MPQPAPSHLDIAIIGAGIAGLACAITCATHGARCVIIEAAPRIGGRASSFNDPAHKQPIDNCQHVTLGCCTNYSKLLTQLQAEHTIDWHDRYHFIEPGNTRSTITLTQSPSPFHLLGPRCSNWTNARFLSPAARLRVARAALAAFRQDRTSHRNTTARQWLTNNDQQAEEINALWEPLTVSACNASIDRTAASTLLHVLQQGALATASAPHIGVPNAPLESIYLHAPDILVSHGSELRLNAKATRIEPNAVQLADGSTIHARRVVAAVPWHRLAPLIDESVLRTDPRFQHAAKLQPSPIIGGHIHFDAPILDVYAASLVGAKTQWVFQSHRSPSKLHCVISGATKYLRTPPADIADLMEAECRRWLNIPPTIRCTAARIVKEPFATIAPTPDSHANRPDTTGPSGIILAGCYTNTGWPSTMEGAARSGYAAADAALNNPPGTSAAPSQSPDRIPSTLGSRSLRTPDRV